MISSSKTTASLTCKWEPASEVQVNSSATGISNKVLANGANGAPETPEEETEDEQDLDQPLTTVKATQSKSQQPRATPQLSNQRSIVIQETPTAARVAGVTNYSGNSEMEVDPPQLPEDTPTPKMEQIRTQLHTLANPKTERAPEVKRRSSKVNHFATRPIRLHCLDHIPSFLLKPLPTRLQSQFILGW
jgi:hypothetical protein